MPIKTAHITNYYHRNSGGISTSYNKLLEAANRRKREVILIVPGERTEVETVGEYGRIYFIQAPTSPVFDKRYRLMMPWRAFMPDGSPVKNILRKEKPDLIEIGEKYTLSLMAGLLRKRLMNVSPDRPLLVHSSCERMDDNLRTYLGGGGLSKWFSNLVMANYLGPMFDFHLANSDYTLGELIEARELTQRSILGRFVSRVCSSIWKAPEIELQDRLFINECGVDLEVFSPARRSPEARSEIAATFKVDPDAKWLLYAGRLSPEKNLSLLLATMAALKQEAGMRYNLIIVGDGPEGERLRNRAKTQFPGQFYFSGQISDKERLADIYANSDIFVHPNPREPFGIAPLEAMASGLPLVAPNTGGILAYANDDNAWITSPNGSDFAATIIAAIENPSLRKQKTKAALAVCDGYSWEASTNARFALYDHMFEIFSTNRLSFDYVPEPVGVDYSF